MSDHENFLRDVSKHVMTIEQDNDVHRCIYFGRPGSMVYSFRLVTWPGGLAITGDCDDFMFSRTRDMFTFFRDESMTGKINKRYWHEKMPSHMRTGAKVYSDAMLKDAVKQDSEEWEVRLGDADKIREELEQEFGGGFSNEHEAYEAVNDFRSQHGGHEFVNFEYDLKDYSHHYVWAIRAIVWGIKQYDLVQQGRTQADHDRRVLAGEI